MKKEIRITKNEAIRKSKQFKILLGIFGEQYPATQVINQVFYNGKIIEENKSPFHNKFYGYFSEANGAFWLVCTDYLTWRLEDYQQLTKDIRTAAREEGFDIFFAFAFADAETSDREHCAKVKTMFYTNKKNEA